MKRSSSALDRSSTNSNDNNDDNETYQASYSKMARYSSSRSRYDQREQPSMDSQVVDNTSSLSSHQSNILGSFSNPPTYVIHFLDTHLTFLQSFQICSLFGRVRIHGHTLRPSVYYSIYNYRTNTALPMEFIPSVITMNINLQDIKSMIPNEQLAENIASHVRQKGGDILLIRNESTNDSLFIQTIRKHRFYSKLFMENYQFFSQDKWKQMEQDLQIRFIETSNSNAIIPRNEFISTIDRIINRWLSETTEDFPFVVLICGEKDMGKSTFTRQMINRALNHINSIYNLIYFDCDIGQCEFTMGGCVSYKNLTSPLLGPPFSHIQANMKPDRLLYYGLVSPQASPVRYLQYIDKLRQLWNVDYRNRKPNRSMILVNTMGWGTGLGLELLKETICMCCPNVIIQLTDNMTSSQVQNRMPDITLQWLLEQPVFVPYRQTLQMSSERQKDYDGELNYEYIKLQSAAIANIQTRPSPTEIPKIRARDYRLFATWSYFFSLRLNRIDLPWSQIIHVSLLDNANPNTLPDSLEKSIVGFCSNENINQLQNKASPINGIHQILDYQDQIFECFGFGWIERCNKQTQTYEIYTPIDCLTNIRILISGAFDTPDEFQYMFKRITVE
ncbi:hypothetical protein I4U23_001340 [Adineta vaga]|nr:hypothetical protein I4U23_001340 [Adineta vaga]